jgi:N-acetylglucosaminyl-diphospho-decaprenol L-rhamnosyltransferase
MIVSTGFALRAEWSELMSGVVYGSPIIIVSYRTPGDVAACLSSLDALAGAAAASVHICENGGAAAWDALHAVLLNAGGPCVSGEQCPSPIPQAFVRVAGLRLRRSGRLVFIAEARENFGYSGGINAWLAPLMRLSEWTGCWILNPDTLVAPSALSALEQCARDRDLGVVGSRLMANGEERLVQCRGLRWRSILASVLAVGRNDAALVEPAPDAIEALLHSPSGASCYFTRPCIEAIFPLDERYFLFFEDLDWGVRARRAGFRIGHAHASVVVDQGGTSAGGGRSTGSVGSPLSIYLGFRNRLLFVEAHHRRWLWWTALMGCLHALRLSLRDRAAVQPAFHGLLAGLRGETGRPDRLVARHRLPDAPSSRAQIDAPATSEASSAP